MPARGSNLFTQAHRNTVILKNTAAACCCVVAAAALCSGLNIVFAAAVLPPAVPAALTLGAAALATAAVQLNQLERRFINNGPYPHHAL